MLLGFYLLLNVLYVTKGCTLINNTKTSNITAHVGDAVLLPCSCSDLQIKPQKLSWKYYNLKTDWNSVPTNQSRIQLSNVQSPGNLSLLISHLTVEDDGFYRCEISQYVYTDINLIVKEGNKMSKAFFAFIPVLLLLLGLGGVIFWRYRAKKREQTPSNKGPTGQKNVEETQGKEQETQEGVTYTTVVHNNTTQRPKMVSTEERTEYAIIKLN
ncbi:uncharacterized protein LOC113529408 [Pangasianodon hypophthalmus]|uniref:uncharacterized protein LOC113529408 n=1 Tax=Pangasianodon hypophthalmus TaxID=310915 RepID=UPI00148052CF|nr:uncharacterized protein LOC113529408 [Pangasianodon hypophthalmus]